MSKVLDILNVLCFKEAKLVAPEVDTNLWEVKSIVSVFNLPDRAKEVVLPGYFEKDVANPPAGVWAHDMKQPVAKTLSAKELYPGDSELPPALKEYGGLLVHAKFNDETQRGRDAFSDIKKEIVTQYSFGYMTTQAKEDKTKGLVYLEKGDWLEWSPVVAGCMPYTQTLEAKFYSIPNSVDSKTDDKVDDTNFSPIIDESSPKNSKYDIISKKDLLQLAMENDRRVARIIRNA